VSVSEESRQREKQAHTHTHLINTHGDIERERERERERIPCSYRQHSWFSRCSTSRLRSAEECVCAREE